MNERRKKNKEADFGVGGYFERLFLQNQRYGDCHPKEGASMAKFGMSWTERNPNNYEHTVELVSPKWTAVPEEHRS